MSRFSGASLNARFLRGSVFTLGGYVSSQVIRLGSNLILTRLLFPEAFGVMALVLVIIQGLMMFSDVGITPAIMQSKRGDDQRFLDTAWTIQVVRGTLLWLFACVIALPIAWVYEEPLLAWILPISGLSLLVSGFNPTRKDTANRHLMLGRVTLLELIAQVFGILVSIGLAWFMQSVWALVIGGLCTPIALLVLCNLCLPGTANRFRWEPEAAHELIHFGKWIFLSTICGFLVMQADKLLLGKYLSFDHFGIYNIGFVLASLPLFMNSMFSQKVLIPVFRERPPMESAENFRKLRKLRLFLTGGMIALTTGLSIAGVVLIDVLYDPRYAMAGAVVVLIAVMQIPQLITVPYDQVALANGDSRRFFVVTAARAVLTVVCILLGLHYAGLFGALVAQGVVGVAVYPFVAWMTWHSGAWDVRSDIMFAGAAVAGTALSIWLNLDAVRALAAL